MSVEAFAPGLHAEYRIANAPVLAYPYPHFYLRDVFPRDYYGEIQRNLPDPTHLLSLEEGGRAPGYPERFVMKIGHDRPPGPTEAQYEFWMQLARWVFGGSFGSLVLSKFDAVVSRRLQGITDMEITDELMLVHDRTRYALGPHTDSPRKVVSLLFYLPADESLAQHGTSIYLPRDRAFTCAGGPHHGFEGFDRLVTMPFLPNSLFGFVKTDNSFHGVEPFLVPGAGRWLLIYDLRLHRIAPADRPPAAEPKIRFTF